MARINKTIYAILGILSIQPMSGYDIKNRLKQWVGGFWAEHDGQIYPNLAQLQKTGLIKCQKTVSTGKRQRQIYAITTDGLSKLKSWLAEPATKTVMRNELKLKLFFGYQMSQQVYIMHINRHKEKMQEHLKYLLSVEQHLREEHLQPVKKPRNKKNGNHIPEAFYWLLSLKGGIYHIQADLKWCEEAEKMIQNKACAYKDL